MSDEVNFKAAIALCWKWEFALLSHLEDSEHNAAMLADLQCLERFLIALQLEQERLLKENSCLHERINALDWGYGSVH